MSRVSLPEGKRKAPPPPSQPSPGQFSESLGLHGGERLLSLCLSPGREGGGSLGLCSRRESIGHWEKKRGKEEEAEAEPPLSRRGEEKGGGGRGKRESFVHASLSLSFSLSLSTMHCPPLFQNRRAFVEVEGEEKG